MVVNFSILLSQPRSVLGGRTPITENESTLSLLTIQLALFCLTLELSLLIFEVVVVVAASEFGYGTPKLGTTPLCSTKICHHAPNKAIDQPASSMEPPSAYV